MNLKDIRKGVVYKIHTPGGIYVGSTISGFSHRWTNHIWQMSNNRHPNKALQQQWDRHGPLGFSFFVLEIDIDPNTLKERETYWIRKLNAHTTGLNAQEKSGQLIHKADKIKAVVEDIESQMTYRKIVIKYGISLGSVTGIKKRYIS